MILKNSNIIVPAYDFNASEDKVLLLKGSATTITGNVNCHGTGSVYLKYLPEPSICIDCSFKKVKSSASQQLLYNYNKDVTLKVHINGLEFEGHITSINWHVPDDAINLQLSPSNLLYLKHKDVPSINKIIFHVFNFVEFRGNRNSSEKRKNASKAIYHYDLQSDEWLIQIKSLFESSDNFKIIKEKGLCRITHVGQIAKVNGQNISHQEAVYVINMIRFFLSFAKGAWCDPVCPVGYDSQLLKTWEQWSPPNNSRSNPSWFDAHKGELNVLFPLFVKAWNEERWQKALKEALYFYFYSNYHSESIPADIGIILSQSAIERLSYEYAVNQKNLLTMNGFKGLWASDKFRILFSSLGIPLDIPNETPELKRIASAGSWIDAPQAITEIRNSIVHPEHKQRGNYKVVVMHEAWNLKASNKMKVLGRRLPMS